MRRAVAILAFVLSINVNAGLIVEVEGENYEISTIFSIHTYIKEEIESQLWWGDWALAGAFANAVGDQLGAINGWGDHVHFGFQYSGTNNQVVNSMAYKDRYQRATESNVSTIQKHFAIATKLPSESVSVSEPTAPVLLLSGLVGLGIMRRKSKSA